MGVDGLAMVMVMVPGRCSFVAFPLGSSTKQPSAPLRKPVDRLESVVGPFLSGSPALSRLVTPSWARLVGRGPAPSRHLGPSRDCVVYPPHSSLCFVFPLLVGEGITCALYYSVSSHVCPCLADRNYNKILRPVEGTGRGWVRRDGRQVPKQCPLSPHSCRGHPIWIDGPTWWDHPSSIVTWG